MERDTHRENRERYWVSREKRRDCGRAEAEWKRELTNNMEREQKRNIYREIKRDRGKVTEILRAEQKSEIDR